jgi:hypothetical protein
MKDAKFKQIYAFFILIATIGWAVFAVVMTWYALKTCQAENILVAGGADLLLGSLIVWAGNVNQYFFRKKPSESDIPTETKT